MSFETMFHVDDVFKAKLDSRLVIRHSLPARKRIIAQLQLVAVH